MNHSHLPKQPEQANPAPIPMHKRLAMGERCDGMTNPNGAMAATDNKVANNQGKTY